MKAIAFMPAYNEADIIGWTVRHLRRQGLDVLVIDCHSTDGTRDMAASAGAQIEMYKPPPVSWYSLLQFIEIEAAKRIGEYDWAMLCDADEMRCGGTEGLNAEFERIQRAGCNAVSFHVRTFHPTADSAEFDGSQDPEVYFRYWSDDTLNQRIGQVKAWHNAQRVRLADSGGHQVQFVGRKVYPFEPVSKHYPIRSQAHGERKVFAERRWLDQSQGRMSWHVQYNDIRPGHNFIKDAATLKEWK